LAIGFATATSDLHPVIGTIDSATRSSAIGFATTTSDLPSVIGTSGSATPSSAIGSVTANERSAFRDERARFHAPGEQ
jgi:hypothetical protein